MMNFKVRKWFRRAFKLIGALVVLLIFLFIFIQSGWFKRKIADYAQNALLEATGYSVVIGKISGVLPFNAQINEVTLSDSEGKWLELENISIGISVSKAVRRSIHITHLFADSIALERIPESISKEDSPSDKKDWRSLMPNIFIKTVKIKEISLGDDVLGEKTFFLFQGELNAVEPMTMISGGILIKRLYSNECDADLKFSIEGSPPVFSIILNIDDSAEGDFARLLQIKNAGRMQIKIKGKGPIDSWRGDVYAKIENFGDIDTQIIISKQSGDFDFRKPNPSISGSINANFILDESIIHTSGEYDFSNGIISFSNAKAETQYGNIEGNITVGTHGLFDGNPSGEIEGEFTLKSKIDDFSEKLIPEGHTVRGDVVSEIRLSGLMNKPEISGELKISEGIFEDSEKNTALGNINLETSFNLRNGILALPDFRIEKNDSHVAGKFDFEFGEPIWDSDFDGDFHASLEGDFALGEFVQFILPEKNILDGKLSMEIDASGTLNEPYLSGKIRAENACYSRNTVEYFKNLKAQMTFNFEKDLLNIKNLNIEENENTISGAFIFHIDPVKGVIMTQNLIEGNIQAKIDLKKIETFTDFPGDIKGLLETEIEISGSIKQPEFKGNIKLDDTNFLLKESEIAIENISADASLSLKNGVFEVHDFRMSGGGIKADGNFRYDGFSNLMNPDNNANMKGEFIAEAQISDIANIFSLDANDPKGKVIVKTTAEGTLLNPALKGSLSVKDGSILEPSSGKPIEGLTADINFAVQDGVINLDTTNFSALSSNITANLKMQSAENALTWNQDNIIDGSISLNIDLTPLSPFMLSPDNLLEGNLDAKLGISGTVSSPALTGEGTLSKGYYENISTGTIIKDINAVIKAEGSELIFTDISANDGEKGILKGRGRLNLDASETKPLEIEISIDNSTLVRKPEFTAIINGNLSAEGSMEMAIIAGNLTATRLEIRLPERFTSNRAQIELLQDIIEVKEIVKPAPDAESVAETIPFNIDLDITFSAPSKAFVRGHGLDSEWQGELAIKGNINNPSITGRLSTVRGSIEFANKRFVLSESHILFDGSTPISPSMDVTAETAANNITAIIRISGPLSSPSFAISSIPSIPQNEILSQVLFSKNSSDITAIQALQLRRTILSLSGGRDAFDFMDQTRVIMGLDRLELEQSSDDDTSISAGKYIADDIYFKVNKKVTGSGGGISAEKQVTPNISVETGVDSDGTQGLQIKWKWDY